MVTEDQVRSALAAVKYPGFSRDIVSFGLVKAVRIEAGTVTVQMDAGHERPRHSACDQNRY